MGIARRCPRSILCRAYARCAVQLPEQRSLPERPLQRPLPELAVKRPEPEAVLPMSGSGADDVINGPLAAVYLAGRPEKLLLAMAGAVAGK